MKRTHFTVTPFWDKRHIKAGTKDESPISITINIGQEQFRIRLKLYSTKEIFDKAISGKGGTEEIKALRKEILDYVIKAEKILERLPNPNRDTFKRLFKSETDLFVSNKTSIEPFFNSKIDEMKKEKRLSTGESYRLAKNSLLQYKSPLHFEDVTEKFLRGYVASMSEKGNSITTAQIYLRNLRHIFNQAIKDKFISERFYPFKSFSIGTSAKSKAVLYPPQLKQLWEYEPIGLRERRAKAFFFMSYLCNGMNFADIVNLKWPDINKDTLSFIREKTKRTNTVVDKKVVVHLHPEAKKIINDWGNKKTDNGYVFPFFNSCKTAEEREKTKNRHKKVCNQNLSAIGKYLGFDVHLCLSLARHSFATALKLNGTPIAFISDAMGHSSTRTTENYLKSIPDDTRKAISSTLLNF